MLLSEYNNGVIYINLACRISTKQKKIVILILSSSKMLTVLLVVLSIVTLCDWKVPFSSFCLNGYT